MKYHEMLQRRETLAQQMRTLNDKTKTEKRSFNTDESRQWNEALKEHDHLVGLIKHEEQLRAIDDEFVRNNGASNSTTNGGDIYRDDRGHEMKVLGKGQDFYRSQSYSSEQEHLTPGAMLRAMIFGAKNDVEARALGGSDAAGGITVPTETLNQLIDMMRKTSQAVNAGVLTTLLNTERTKIAKIESDPVPSWRAINSAINDSDPTFSGIELNARSLAVMFKVPRELLEDSINLESAIATCLAGAMAQEFDRAVFFGAGTAVEPTGIVNTTGILAQALDGQITSYAPVMNALELLENSNSINHTAAVMAPRSKYAFGGLTDTTGQPIRKPEIIADLPFLATNQFPINEGTGTNESSLLVGDFSKVLIGLRSNLRIEVLKERYAENNQYAFVAHMRGDVAVTQPKALCKITGVQPKVA